MFIDENDNYVLTYSPYLSANQYEEVDGKKVGSYTIIVADYSIYGNGTKTIVVKRV